MSQVPSLLNPQMVKDFGRTAQDSLVKTKTWQDVGNVAGAAIGGGMALRGLQGLYNTMRRNLGHTQEPNSPPVLVIPDRQKAAFNPFNAMMHPLDTAGEAITAGAGGVSDFLAGHGAEQATDWPMHHPLMLGAGALGMAGGWKGMDYLLDSQRKGELNDDLKHSREQFEQALQPGMASNGSALGQDLDRLYARQRVHHKAADGPSLGSMTGMALAGWPLIAGATGYATYKALKARQNQHLLSSALQQRHRQQINAPMYAIPEDILRNSGDSETADEPETQPGLAQHQEF